MVKYAQHIERGTDLAWLIYRVSCSAFIFGIGLRVWSIATNGYKYETAGIKCETLSAYHK